MFWQGLFFIFLLLWYCWLLFKKNNEFEGQQKNQNGRNVYSLFLKINLGIVGLGFGAHYFVLGAQGLANALKVPPIVIGMSIVALGTSLPELAACIAAAKHNETDFIIGNIIGSNIMNIVAVLGLHF